MGNDLTDRPVLVTGAAGYLGCHVLEVLRRRGIAAVGATSPNKGERSVDLTVPEAVRRFVSDTGADRIIHCAARVPKNDAEYADDDAAEDSLRMVTSLVAARPRHIVYPSSMTVYGAATRLPLREEDAADDLRGYAKGKKRAESVLFGAADVGVTVLRIPGLFGPPRRGGFIYNAARAFAEGRAPRVPDEPPVWAAMHVSDAAELCVRAIERPPAGSRVINAGYPQRMSLCSVLGELAAIFGRPCPPCHAPEFEMDLSRLGRELGMPAYDLTSRLKEVAAWAREHATCGSAT